MYHVAHLPFVVGMGGGNTHCGGHNSLWPLTPSATSTERALFQHGICSHTGARTQYLSRQTAAARVPSTTQTQEPLAGAVAAFARITPIAPSGGCEQADSNGSGTVSGDANGADTAGRGHSGWPPASNVFTDGATTYPGRKPPASDAAMSRPMAKSNAGRTVQAGRREHVPAARASGRQMVVAGHEANHGDAVSGTTGTAPA